MQEELGLIVFVKPLSLMIMNSGKEEYKYKPSNQSAYSS